MKRRLNHGTNVGAVEAQLLGLDMNDDGCIDLTDLNIIMAQVRAHSTNLTYNLNGDGKVDIADAPFLALHFTNPGGAPCASAASITSSFNPKTRPARPVSMANLKSS